MAMASPDNSESPNDWQEKPAGLTHRELEIRTAAPPAMADRDETGHPTFRSGSDSLSKALVARAHRDWCSQSTLQSREKKRNTPWQRSQTACLTDKGCFIERFVVSDQIGESRGMSEQI